MASRVKRTKDIPATEATRAQASDVEPTHYLCPHCGGKMMFGTRKLTQRKAFRCTKCRTFFEPQGLTISHQDAAINKLRRQKNLVLREVNKFLKEFDSERVSAARTRELIKALKEGIAPVTSVQKCPECGDKPLSNCSVCFGSGMKSNL